MGERYLKDGSFSVWSRNLQVSAWSLFLYVVLEVIQGARIVSGETASRVEVGGTNVFQSVYSIFVGWSAVTWLVAILGACGGLLVAFATKHSDAVSKTIATSVAVILVVSLEVPFLGVPLDPIVCIASLIAAIALESYRDAGALRDASRNNCWSPVGKRDVDPTSVSRASDNGMELEEQRSLSKSRDMEET